MKWTKSDRFSKILIVINNEMKCSSYSYKRQILEFLSKFSFSVAVTAMQGL